MQTDEKGPYAFCGQRRSRSACSSVQSNLGIFCSSTYTTVSTDSVSGQRRPRSACAYAQADQGLRWPQTALGPFSCVMRHIKCQGSATIKEHSLLMTPRGRARQIVHMSQANESKCSHFQLSHFKTSSVECVFAKLAKQSTFIFVQCVRNVHVGFPMEPVIFNFYLPFSVIVSGTVDKDEFRAFIHQVSRALVFTLSENVNHNWSRWYFDYFYLFIFVLRK